MSQTRTGFPSLTPRDSFTLAPEAPAGASRKPGSFGNRFRNSCVLSDRRKWQSVLMVSIGAMSSRSKGGGDEAANGTFEVASLNRSRGAEQMTVAEIEAASKVLTETAFVAALEEVALKMLGAALVGGAVSCVISVLESGLEYQRGDITREEMHRRIGNDVAKSAAVSSAVSGVIAAVALAFPAFIPLAAPLMMPLAALAICIVGGKVVRLGKGWYELHHEVWSRGMRGRVPMLRFRWRLID